ncbi:MAG: sigma-70 family RNA polymerase sigma factor [Bacillus sp. (in: Bacteria)]|nr:sigma-70 family RNA polymerase sigma factor [Bacillus sp. (in: firmicutes)]
MEKTNDRERDFEACYEAYLPMIYAIMGKLELRKDKDEYLQIGSIALYEAWQKYDLTKGDFAPFAYSYVSGKIMKSISKNDRWGRHNHLMGQDSLNQLSPPVVIDQERLLIDDWLNRASLSKREKFWITEGYMKGYTIEEVASIYGIHASTVKGWRQQALRKLKKVYSKG